MVICMVIKQVFLE